MAKKKKGKGRGKKRTASQKRAFNKMIKARKKSLRKKPKRRKKSSAGGVAAHYHSGARGLAARQSSSQGVASHYHSGSRGLASHYAKSSAKKARRRAKQKGGVVTAASILRNVRTGRKKAWVCVGPRRSGCGGGAKGRRGSRVAGILR